MALNLIARGVFSWHPAERITTRYGAFMINKESYNGDVASNYQYQDIAKVASLVGKRVKVLASVFESRPSGHIGDLFLGIYPKQPLVGDTVKLGLGVLDYVKDKDRPEWSEFVLHPEDAREQLWIDPYKLYNLHDQTVDLWIGLLG